jgi:hypothetical protein
MAGNEHVPVAAPQAGLHVLGQRQLPIGLIDGNMKYIYDFNLDRAELYGFWNDIHACRWSFSRPISAA